MYIVIHCGGMPFDGLTIKEKSLGGSETAAYYLALELARKGHHVSVFTNLRSDETKTIDGVRYSWSGEVTKETPLGASFTYFAENTPHNVLIIQRHPQAFAKRYASNVNLLWLHDLALYRYSPMIQSQLWNVDGILTVSEFHKNQTIKVYDVDKSIVFPIQNGVSEDLFDKLEDPELYKKYSRILSSKRTLFYSSRPERGLDNLVKPNGIMEQLGEDYHLFFCGYENTTTQMQNYYNWLHGRANQLPNVTNLGALTKPELMHMMQTVGLLVYPTNFEEVSCITAMEAMAAELPMITSAHAALPETCKDSGTILLPLEDGQVNIDLFVKKIRHLLSIKGDDLYCQLSLNQKEARRKYTWDVACQKLLGVINECHSRITPDARVLDALRVSDIMRLDNIHLDTAVGKSAQWQRNHLYAFTKSDKAMREHYNDKGEEFKREVPRGSPRYEVTLERIEEYILSQLQESKERVFNIFDVGGNIGHYSIGLVQDLEKRIKDLTGYAVDVRACIYEFSESAKKYGNEWIRAEALHNKVYYYNPNCHSSQRFDVVLFGEIVEHVVHPIEFVDETLSKFADDGAFTLVTLPYGPWESQEYRANDPHREHLWHFSRGDLERMFGGGDEYRLSCLPYGKSISGEPLGNYVVSFRYVVGVFPDEVMILNTTLFMPRESLSLCMIVKDGESVLKRCLDSVIGLVDEIIIGVDESTTDGTIGVIERYQKEMEEKNFYCPITWMRNKSAVSTGFDVARNQVLQHVTSDWVLWLDADEVLFGLNNVTKYLRPNQYSGYLIKQQHFSVEPAGILRTDYPAKLFRRSSNAKFYGVVHEHPGTSPNEGIGKTAIIPDVIISHDGYQTEGIRRLRFHRNVQLMIRDREKYPDRVLGIFLWMRDVSHMMKFELENNGNRVTDDIVIKAKRGIQLFEELLEKADVRMIADGLEYYTNFVNVLGGGFEMSLGIAAIKGNGAATLSAMADKTKTAKFLNTAHAERYMKKVFTQEVRHYDNKYF